MENGGQSTWLEVEFVLVENREMAVLGFPTTPCKSGDVYLVCDCRKDA